MFIVVARVCLGTCDTELCRILLLLKPFPVFGITDCIGGCLVSKSSVFMVVTTVVLVAGGTEL